MVEKTVLIIEDHPAHREMLKKLVLEVDGTAIIHEAGDLSTAYTILMEKTIDVFLVDIILDTSVPGDTSGIRLVKRIREIPKYMFTPVLFITSLEDNTGYAYKDLNCLGYVEKPFLPDRVRQLVKKALNFSTAKEQDAVLCFRKDGVLYPIKVRDIVYMDSYNHVFTVHLLNGSTLTVPYRSCKQLIDEADADCLLQCNRSAIVNKDYVENIDIANRYITMKGIPAKVEIGITFKKKVLAEYGI